jgi:hypothetical protein
MSAQLAPDDHRHGLYALSPLTLLVMVAVCAIAYWIFSTLQITSTEQTVYGLLQVGVQLTPSLTGAQVWQYTSGSLDHYQVIAAAIGWSVQIALLILSFPPDSALLRMHRRYNDQVTQSLTMRANVVAKVRTLMMVLLIGGDIATDFWFVASGHAFLGLSGATIGVLLVAVIYPTGICFITIYVGKYLFAYLDALIGRLRVPVAKTTTPTASK